MDIRLTGIIRGDGFVYCQLKISDASSDSQVSLSATANNTRIPCALYPLDSASGIFLAALPLLTCRMTLSVTAVSGGTTETSSTHISPFRSTWESRFNYHFKSTLASKLFGLAKTSESDRISISLDEIIPGDSQQVVRGTLTTSGGMETRPRTRLWTLTADTLNVSPTYFEKKQHRRQDMQAPIEYKTAFSLLLPNELQGFCIEISTEVEGEPCTTFVTLDSASYAERLSEVHRLQDPINVNYSRWYEGHRASGVQLGLQATVKFDYVPTFSIVVPLFHTNPEHFEAMLASVTSQSWSSWQLILINASPEDSDLSSAIARVQQSRDSRINVVTLEKNLGITENTKAGLAVASGDFVCFLDHDDTLSPDALYEYALAVNRDPDIDALYCDEDKLRETGAEYFDPYFKPDYSPHLLRCFNYITHFLCIRASVFAEIDSYATDVEGAQDYDLTLKACEKARNVHHVARILYHWRVSKDSTADDPSKKSYADEAGRRALQAHLDRVGLNAKALSSGSPCLYRAEYTLEQPAKKVSIIIPIDKYTDTMERCLSALFDITTYPNYEVILIEATKEGSSERRFQEIAPSAVPCKFVPWEKTFDSVAMANHASTYADGSYLLFLAAETTVLQANWLQNLVAIATEGSVGAVGAKILAYDGTVEHTGKIITAHGVFNVLHGRPSDDSGYARAGECDKDVSAISGLCFLTKKALFDELGGFSKDFQRLYADVDYCLSIREKGLWVVNTPRVSLRHRTMENPSLNTATTCTDFATLVLRHADFFETPDPFYNPNFTERNAFYQLTRKH